MKMTKLVGVVCLGLFMAVLVGCSSKGNNPEQVAVAYVEYAYKGDADGMIKLMYLPKEQMKDGGEEIVRGKVKQTVARAVAEADRKGGVKEILVESSEIDEPNGKGSVKIVTHFKNEGSKSQNNRIKLVRSDNQWKVNP